MPYLIKNMNHTKHPYFLLRYNIGRKVNNCEKGINKEKGNPLPSAQGNQ